MPGAHGKQKGGWAVGLSGQQKVCLFLGLCYKVGSYCLDSCRESRRFGLTMHVDLCISYGDGGGQGI